MTIDLRTTDASEDWRRTVQAYADLFRASIELHASVERLLARDGDAVALLRRALRSRDRPAALHVLRHLPPDLLKDLLPDLVYLANFDHPDLSAVRESIRRLPHSWLVSHLDTAAREYLQDADDASYRRLLELYVDVDLDLALRLANEAAASDDQDVREVGVDFLPTTEPLTSVAMDTVLPKARARLQEWRQRYSTKHLPDDRTWSSSVDLVGRHGPGAAFVVETKHFPKPVIRRGLGAAARTLGWSAEWIDLAPLRAVAMGIRTEHSGHGRGSIPEQDGGTAH